MKKAIKILSFFLVLCLVGSMAGCGSPENKDAGTEVGGDREITSMNPGEYVVEVDGYKPMKVKVTLGEKEIEKIEVIEHEETQGVSDVALEEIPEAMVAQQSVGVDTITGATLTSQGIIDAVRQAIEEAGGIVEEFELGTAGEEQVSTEVRQRMSHGEVPDTWDMTYDVVVVGGGFAGLAAAYSATENGAETLLIDKMPVLGGNSQINGGVYASYTSSIADEMYEALGLEPDTAEKHIEDTIVGGDYLSDEKLVRNFVYGAPFFLDMMLENGLEVRESITRPGGHYGYRTYTTINGVGADIVQVQKDMLEDTDATIMLNTEMTGIYREGGETGRVVGIEVKTKDGVKTVQAEKGVILTTGGFGGNVEMRSKHVPSLTADIPTTNHVGATGEAITMAQELGANTMHMSYIQLYPFANPNNGVLDAYAVIPFSGPSSGIVYVDEYGQRYVNEGERRDVCSRAAQESGGFPTFSIFDQEIVEKGGFISEEQLTGGIKDDRIFKADSLEELAQMINGHQYADHAVNMAAEALVETIEQHNGFIDDGNDPEFGKVIDQGIMMKIDQGPYYAIPQWPSVHHTMGGLTITERTEVQDIWGEVIPGLYAAGEVTGGVHGTNRLGSNAIPDAAVHGYIAGEIAVTGKMPNFIPEQ
ncbi:flavocytochrome c [Tindallia californiensis]|uniref:Urocanate reductase n=1 Tax=Tindallia californiensis TaxID=159292 RepID=A0A1H3P4F1_9FIRM|nr:flavocytochrome c [Tindallia californiensis]SDY95948.1 fumarate reductase flavoprotein subunit [Tindallia californiensis]